MDSITFPEWYQSSRGPGIAQTIKGLVLNFLPVINLVLASRGVNLLPEAVNLWVSLLVFVGFSVYTLIGYVRGKRAQQLQIGELEREVGRLGGRAVQNKVASTDKGC